MNYRLLVLLCTPFYIYGLRDPFVRADGEHVYAYLAYGALQGKEAFAVLTLDGISYYVKKGDTVAGHMIIDFSHCELVIADEHGKQKHVLLQEKALQLR